MQIQWPTPGPDAPESTASQRSQQFAKNLTDLLDLLPQNMRRASETILDVPYKWLRRVVSTGISRLDERSSEHLQKITDHFELPRVEDLWRNDLLCWLLENQHKEGEKFVQKFDKEIVRLRDSESERLGKLHSSLQRFDYKRLRAMNHACGDIPLHSANPPMTDSDVIRFLNEWGFPGLIDGFQDWRQGDSAPRTTVTDLQYKKSETA